MSVLKAPIVAEMRTILRDVRVAQERAAVATGAYVGTAELSSYLDRAVPESYRIEISDAAPEGYSAVVVHERSGLACRLQTASGRSDRLDCD